MAGRDSAASGVAAPFGNVNGFIMRALRLVAEQQLELVEVADPAPPGEGGVEIRVLAVAMNHIDVWGYRGMAFAKRKLPLVVGAEAVGEIAAVGAGVANLAVGQRVVMYGAHTCGHCASCRAGRDNLCENVGGVMGFHIDGFARERVVMPARLVIPVPDGVSTIHAACAAVTFSTVEHMLFDNARLRRGETILVHAGGSGIGTAAITLAKAAGCLVITTVGGDAKGAKARALGADHVINYRTERFENVVRKLTGKQGVDVVFEHTGADTWRGSLLSLRRGGRLVTCGATSGSMAEMNLMQLFQQQHRIIGSFGATIGNVGDGLQKMAIGLKPTIDAEAPIEEFGRFLERLRDRDVFGKLVVRIAS
jgi:alcohol dehydrogenase